MGIKELLALNGYHYDPQENKCLICGTPDSEKPMCNRGEIYCSEEHKKELAKRAEFIDGVLVLQRN